MESAIHRCLPPEQRCCRRGIGKEEDVNLPAVMALAASNHGLIGLREGESVGVSRRQLERMTQRGVLRHVYNNVWIVEGSPHTWDQRALVAVWSTGAGALLSHWSAGAVWGLSARRGVEVLVPMSTGARPPGVRVHQTRFLTGVDVDQRHGIPVTSIERTLVDLAAVSPLGRLARLLDAAVSEGLTTHEQIVSRLVTMPTRGRKGVPMLRLLLQERIGCDIADGNPFEHIMAGLIARSDLPSPVRQYMVCGSESRYYLDFAFPEYKVAIECDGLMGHGSPSAQSYDLKRQNEIIEDGWNLRRFSWSQVNTEPAQVLASIRNAMVASGWRPPAN